jgi:hypothetical protein
MLVGRWIMLIWQLSCRATVPVTVRWVRLGRITPPGSQMRLMGLIITSGVAARTHSLQWV